MTIVFIVNGISGSGGLERVLSIKTDYLIQNYRYKVHIVSLFEATLETFYPFHEEVRFHSITDTVPKGKLARIFGPRKELKQLLSKIKPKVISVCDDGLKGLFFPMIYGKETPMVYERHASKKIFTQGATGLLNNIRYRWFNILSNRGARKYDALVVLTQANANEWKGKNIKVIPNPLSFTTSEKSTLQNKRIIVVGNHSYNKGYDRLLEIWKVVHEKHPEWKLDVYGKAQDRSVIDLADAMGLSETVCFYDPVKNIHDKYLESSICAMTSRSEGFGMVLIEAMNCGVPCVAFDCPSGPRDIIKNEMDGFLIENGNIKNFAEKLSFLIENEEKRIILGANARTNVARYHESFIIPQWNELYKNLARP